MIGKTPVISICGIDGAGKTTLTDLVMDRLNVDYNLFRRARLSYYREKKSDERIYVHKSVGNMLDKVMKFADTTRNMRIIGMINTITLYVNNHIEARAEEKYNLDIMIRARDMLMDAAVYSPFYYPEFLSQDIEKRLSTIKEITNLDPSDLIIYLDISPNEAVKRIEKRIISENIGTTSTDRIQKWKHVHENEEGLSRLSRNYERALKLYENDGVGVARIDAENNNPENLADQTDTIIRDYLYNL